MVKEKRRKKTGELKPKQKKAEEPEPKKKEAEKPKSKRKKTEKPELKRKKVEKHGSKRKIADGGGKVFKNANFDSRVTKMYMRLRKLVRAPEFDFSIEVGEAKIPVHKEILLKRCLHFRTILQHNCTETSSNSVTVPFTVDMWSQIVDYLYSGTITITLENMFDICIVAGYLMLDKLRKFCEAFIKKNTDHETVEKICDTAQQSMMPAIAEFATNFMEVNFEDFIKHNEMLEWSPELVEELVKSDKLQVRSEAKVVEVVCNWLNFRYDSRKHLTTNLLDQIRYAFLSRRKIADAIDDDVCLDILQRLLHNLNRSAALQLEYHPRIQNKCIYMFGRVHTVHEQYLTFSRYWPNDQSLVTLKSPVYRTCWSATILNDKLYLIGGWKNERINKVEVYDPTEDTWSLKSPLNIPRCDHCCCTYKGQIYVFGGGGQNHNEKLRTEVYSPMEDHWQVLDDCQSKEVIKATVVGDSIFLVSRTERPNNHGCLIQEFKPEQNEWIDLPDNELLRNAGYGINVVSLEKKIYIAKSSKTYIIYDTESKSLKKDFFMPASKRESFKVVQYGGGMHAFRDRIYAYSGWTENRHKYTHSFGVLDPGALLEPSDTIFQFTTSVESDIKNIYLVS